MDRLTATAGVGVRSIAAATSLSGTVFVSGDNRIPHRHPGTLSLMSRQPPPVNRYER
ncbi:hypothetical protein KCP75_22965 [Salmonella enterica subsp. enterica]|nr:hypothetical protein KCP75_22965 [Salmonella enterica subsp. enterica]